MEEMLDLVDEFDNVIGSMPRTEVYEKNLSNFRVINAFLKNDKGELWIPKRTKNKRLFPLHLDASMGGHVSSGESYEVAFKRELKEELNMDLNDFNYKTIASLNPLKNNVSAFMKIYEIPTNVTPDFNKNDFIDGHWLLPEKINNILTAGIQGKPDLGKLINILYL